MRSGKRRRGATQGVARTVVSDTFSGNKKRREIERALGALEDTGRLRRQAGLRASRRGVDPSSGRRGLTYSIALRTGQVAAHVIRLEGHPFVEACIQLRSRWAPTRSLTLSTSRRRGALAAACCALVVFALFVFVCVVSGSHQSLRPAPRPIPTVAPLAVLTEQPWIGNSCPGPHSAAAVEATPDVPLCDRIGVGIGLRTPAVTAKASINGQSFKLDNAAESDPPVHGKHRYLAGFLEHAAFLKRGPFKTFTDNAGYRYRLTIDHVHLVIDYGAGHKVQTSVTEFGYGGWG